MNRIELSLEELDELEATIRQLKGKLEKLKAESSEESNRSNHEEAEVAKFKDDEPSTSTNEVQRVVTRVPYETSGVVELTPRFSIYSIGPRRATSLFNRITTSPTSRPVKSSLKDTHQTSKITIKTVRFTDGSTADNTNARSNDTIETPSVEDENIIPIWLFQEELNESQQQVEDYDTPAVKMYLANAKTRPHHDKWPMIKLAISAFGPNRSNDKPYKLLAKKDLTGHKLHELTRKVYGIPASENLTLVYPQYKVIEPDSTSIWQHGIRYHPAFITRVPENFKDGDLMEVRFVGKGPNMDGNTEYRRYTQ